MKKIRIVIVVVVLAILAVLWYYYFSARSNENSFNSQDTEVTTLSKTLNKDLENNYPNTPREVILFYAQIQECFYNEDCSDDDLEKLANQARMMMDDELLEKNPYGEYLDNLKEDVAEHKENSNKLSTYSVSPNSEVMYSNLNEQKYANLECWYYFKDKKITQKSMQEYILRKDSEGRWKILASDLMVEDE